MTRPILSLAAAPIAAIILIITPLQATAGIKCWENKEGVRECGNSVPPEYAQKGHTEKTASGHTIKKTTRAKTKKELAIEAAAQLKKDAEDKETQRLAAIQGEKDRVLLSTYTTEDDLVLTRNGKLAAIDSRINHSTQIKAGHERTLDGLQKRAAGQERGGKKADKVLVGKIKVVEKQIQDNASFIIARNHEIGEINAQFEANRSRWLELKGITPKN